MRHLAILRLPAAFFLAYVVNWGFEEGPLRDPEAALRDFYQAEDRFEDQLVDPLILNGRAVVPLVLRDLTDKAMPLRRYAIGFLGNGEYEEALPLLESILADETELNYFRSDALEAIHRIAPERAARLALQYMDSPELLGRVAIQIVDGATAISWERSWWDAYFGHHH